MSIKITSLALAATGTAQPISATDIYAGDVHIKNCDATNECFIGAIGVTAANGYKLEKGESVLLSALLAPTHVGDRRLNLKEIYVICSGVETADIRILITKEVT